MLLHSRGGSSERRKVALNELVVEALNLAYHGARAEDPNFNLTPRARRMIEDGPTGAATAATSDCWPNLGLRGPGRLRCDAGSSGGDSAARAELYFALLGAPEIATIALRSTGT
jgi:hypothetical protein